MLDMMTTTLPQAFRLFGQEAILLNGQIEVSAINEDEASKMVVKLADAILDGKLHMLRINLPSKIVFVSAQDKEHLHFQCEDTSNNGTAN